jgi:hypothetical protein
MPTDRNRRKPIIDKLADSTRPKIDDSEVSDRGFLWWLFIMPGKVILWIEYMFPKRIGDVFGSARRRNIPLLQATYSVGFYVVVLFFILMFVLSNAKHG